MAERPFNEAAAVTGQAQAHIDAVALGTSEEQVLWANRTGSAVEITAVKFTPIDLHTGANTNNMALGVTNKELNGAGTVVVCPVKTYVLSTNLVAFQSDDIPVSVTPADVRIEDGEVLSFNKTENGTGLAMPAGIASVEFTFL